MVVVSVSVTARIFVVDVTIVLLLRIPQHRMHTGESEKGESQRENESLCPPALRRGQRHRRGRDHPVVPQPPEQLAVRVHHADQGGCERIRPAHSSGQRQRPPGQRRQRRRVLSSVTAAAVATGSDAAGAAAAGGYEDRALSGKEVFHRGRVGRQQRVDDLWNEILKGVGQTRSVREI